MCGGSSVRVSTMVVTRGSDGMIIDGEANIFLSKYGFLRVPNQALERQNLFTFLRN